MKFKMPHTLVLLFWIMLFALLLTYVLPQGTFERYTDSEGRELIVEGSYQQLDKPVILSPTIVLIAIPKGLEEAGSIIFFVFIVGGFFGVLKVSGAIDAGISSLIKKLAQRSSMLIIGAMIIFSIGSHTFGMAESYIVFVPVLLVLCLGLGYDTMTACGVICVAYAVGFGASSINPFTVLIAQDIAGLKPSSGYLFRIIVYIVLLIIAIHYVLRYAKKIKKDPSKSLVRGIEPDKSWTKVDFTKFNLSHKIILIVLVAGITLMVFGIGQLDWDLISMGALFFGMTIIIALIGKISPDKTAIAFCNGAADLTTMALLIGVARGIQVVLNEGYVVDTIVYAVSKPLLQLGPELAAVGMLLFQSIINFFITSGSGQAYVTMPLMTPLADLVGVSRQVAVLAFQFGDGFTNILVPTNSVLIGILAMAKVPYVKWLRFILPFMLRIFIASSIILVIAVVLGYS
jgi:uncharacterized ion transporter superfamily protein YfcC